MANYAICILQYYHYHYSSTTKKLYNEWYDEKSIEMRCPHSLLSVGLNCSNVSSGKYREWIEVRVYDVTKNVQAPPGTSGIFLG